MTTSSPARGRRPVLDPITRVSYFQISLFAFFLYGFGATQALLRDEQGTTRTIASLHATIFALANVASALFVPMLIERWGRGRVIRYAIITICIGIAVYTAPFGLPASLIGTAIVAAGGVAMIVTTNAFILDYQGAAGPAALTQANALAAFFGFMVPLVIGVTTALAIGWRAGLGVLIAAFLISEVLRSRQESLPAVERAETPRVVHPVRAEKVQLPRPFWWSLGVVALLLAAEFTLTLWSADLLRERAGLGAAAAAASLAAVTGGMLIGRLFGSRMAETWSADRLLTLSILIALSAFAIAWTSTVVWIILVGLFVMGLGISVQWPIGLARAVAASGGMTNKASGLSSVAAGASSGVAPFVLGALSDSIGLHLAFLIIPMLFAGALAIIIAKPMKSSEPIVG